MRFLLVLLVVVSGLLGGLVAGAADRSRPALAFSSPSPDSALVHLTAAQVYSPAMQGLDARVRWRYQPGQPSDWARPATSDLGWLLIDPNFLVGQEPPG